MFERRLASSVLALLVVMSGAFAILGTSPTASAQGTLHDPILIVGNNAFKKQNGVNGGSGTASDPYIIDGWEIWGTVGASAIEIRDTTAFFVIRDCVLQISDGIHLSNVANGTITNVTASGWTRSLRLENCTGISADSSSFDSNAYAAYINNSAGVSITDCRVTGGQWGIFIDLSSDVLCENLTMGMTNVGITLHRSSEVVCNNCTFTSTQNVAVIDEVSDSTLTSSNFTVYYGDGVLLTHTDNFTIEQNRIATTDVPQWIEGWGILASGSENLSIVSNVILARVTGVIVQGCTDSVVYNNSFSYGSWAISESGSSSSLLMNNTIMSMSNGISSTDSVNSTIFENNATVTNTAISLVRSNTSSVIDNSATTATWPNYAVYGDSCWDLLIMNNTRLTPSFVYLNHCVNATLYENNLDAAALVSLDYCDGTVLLNNTITSSDTDVWVRWSTETYLVGNTFHAPKWAVRIESCQGGGAFDNTFPAEYAGNGTVKYGYGVDFEYSSDMLAWGNLFDSFEIGVGISSSPNITVYQNDFTRSSVCVWSSPSCLILNNTFWENSGVSALYDCSNTAIVGNYFPNQGVVSLQDAFGLGLFENVFAGGGVAIWGWDLACYDSHLITSDNLVNGKPILQILDSSGVDITGIDIGELIVVNSEFVNISGLNTSDCFIGMLIAYCANVTIENNTIANDWIGMRLFMNDDLLIDHNHFITNGTGDHIYMDYTDARFNLTYPGGGNYWSDYTGIDLYHGPGQNISGFDGYGDIPYDWFGVVVDHYPILGPFINYPPIAAFFYSPLTGDITTLYVFNASSSQDDEDSNTALQIRWDWDGDGIWDTDWSSNMTAEHIFASAGDYTIRLEVRDSMGTTNITEQQVTVVEEIPEFSFVLAPVLSLLLLLPVIARVARSRWP